MLTSLQAEAFAMQIRTRLSADTINERQAWLNLWVLNMQHIEHFKRSELALRPEYSRKPPIQQCPDAT